MWNLQYISCSAKNLIMQKRKPEIFSNLSIHIVKRVNMSQVAVLSHRITGVQFFAGLTKLTAFMSRLARGRKVL